MSVVNVTETKKLLLHILCNKSLLPARKCAIEVYHCCCKSGNDKISQNRMFSV